MKSHASMNRIYRLVWSRVLNLWVAVAEHAKGGGKAGNSRDDIAVRARACRFALGMLGLFMVLAGVAHAGPGGGQVVAGSGVIGQSGGATTVTQTSARMAIDWNTFSTRAGESVTFVQPDARAIALNRVTGSSPSSLLGSLSANGQVFILNPNGVLFGAGAQVNVGGLVASTLSLSNADFMAGRHTFTKDAGSAGTVVNQGTLAAAPDGYIALLAPEVRNEGVVSATRGTVLMAAGNQVTLTLNNGSLLGYSIDQGALNALADNRQLIQADGGQVILSAQALDALSRASVNNSGTIEARTLQHQAGRILLMGDLGVGTVDVSGTLDASSHTAGDGGFIETSAARVKVADSAVITTLASSGKTGTWLIDPHDFKIDNGGDITGAGLGARLESNNVSISSTDGAGGANGDVLVNQAVSWSANHSLTLNAQRNIDFTGGGSLNAGGATGSVVLTAAGGAIVGKAGSAAVTANSLTASAQSGIGSSAAPLLANVRLAALTNAVGGGIHVDNTGDITVAARSTNGAVAIRTADGGTGAAGGNITVGSVGGLAGVQTLGSGNITLTAGKGGRGTDGTPGDVNLSGTDGGGGGNGGGITLDAALTGASSVVLTAGTGGNGGSGGGRLGGINGAAGHRGGNGGNAGSGGGITLNAASSGQAVALNAGTGGSGGVAGGGGVNGSGGSGGSGGNGGGITLCAALTARSGVDLTAGAAGDGADGGLGGVGREGRDGGNGGSGGVIALQAALAAQGNVALTAGAAGKGGNGAYNYFSDYTGNGGQGGSGGGITLDATLTGQAAVALRAGDAGAGGNGGTTYFYGNGRDGNGGNGGAVAVNAALQGQAAVELRSGTAGAAGDGGPYSGGHGSAGSAGNITLDAALTGQAAVTLNAAGAVVQGASMGVLTASSLTATAAAGIGSPTGSLLTNVRNAAFTNTGSGGIHAINTSDVTVAASSNNGDVVLQTAQGAAGVPGGSLVVGTVGGLAGVVARGSGGNILLRTGNGGGIVLDAAVTGSAVALTSGAAITSSATGVVTADSLAANAATGIGTGGTGLRTQVRSAALTNTGSGGIRLTNSGDITLAASSTNGDVVLKTDDGASGASGGNLTVGTVAGLVGIATRSAGGILLAAGKGGDGAAGSASGAGGNIALDAAIVSQAGVTLNAGAGGSGGSGGNRGAQGRISGTSVDVTAGGGLSINHSVAPTSGGVALSAGTGISNGAGGAVRIEGASTVALSNTAGGLVSVDAGAAQVTVTAAGIASTRTLITTTGDITLQGGISASAAGDAILLAARRFTNNAGAAGLGVANGGRYVVWSQGPATDVFGGLMSGNLAVWNAAYGAANPTVAAVGNRFVFANTKTGIVAAVDASKIYGDVLPPAQFAYSVTTAASDTGAANGHAFTDAANDIVTFTGTAPVLASTGARADATRAGGVSGGARYDITVDLSGTTAAGYTLRAVNGSLTIDARRIDLTGSRTYDGTTAVAGSVFALANVVNNDAASLRLGGRGTVQSPNASAGHAVDTSGLALSGAAAVNYTLAGGSAVVDIDKARLTFTADAATRLYGDTNPALTGRVTGFVNDENLASATTGTAAFGTAAGVTSHVGTYGITGTGLLANHGNYEFVQAAGNASALRVTPASLTFVADAATRLYGSADPALTGQVTGFRNGETLAGATTGVLAFTSAAGATSNVGAYGIAGAGLSANNGNYVFRQAGGNAIALSVTPASLTVTADAVTRLYGQANPALTGSVTGFVNGETLASATTGTAFGTAAVATSNVGRYAIDSAGLRANHGNYVFVQAAGNATALQVTPATLTVTADAVTRLYGQANPALTGSITGFANGETLAGATTGTPFSTGAVDGSNVGLYAVTSAGLQANHGNYVFVQAAGNATALRVAPAPLTVTANDATRMADGARYSGGNGVVYSGFMRGDTDQVLTGNLGYRGTAQGASAAGSYAITPMGLGATNYTLRFVDGTLTLRPADAAQSALGGPALVLAYNGALQEATGLSSGGAPATDAAAVASVAHGLGLGLLSGGEDARIADVDVASKRSYRLVDCGVLLPAGVRCD